MATIITVHGTFAHYTTGLEHDAATAADSLQWWQPGSTFAKHAQQLVSSDSSDVTFTPFVWSGDNSELARRAAGTRLLKQMKELEDRQEPYCVIGHSHGGSVIASALMESAAQRVPLEHLKKWITVGTPFVELRKERLLFLRLPILLKAIFIASLMLLLMFSISSVAEVFDGGWEDTLESQLQRYGISMGLMALPFVVFVGITKYLDRRQLFFYRPGVIKRAREKFSERWLPLLHPDDEAVHGLSSLRTVKFNIFHNTFAVPFFSLASVFILPIAYFYLIASPTHMVGITNFLRDNVYATENFERTEAAMMDSRRKIRDLRRQIRQAQDKLDNADTDLRAVLNARTEIKRLREQLRGIRQELHQDYPNLVQVQRTRRFHRRFLERDGKPCEGGTLCGGGHDILLNSRLMYHLVTDEASSWLVDEEVREGAFGNLIRFAMPIVLVPVVFGIVAVLMVLLVQLLAGLFSSFASRRLDDLTWFEVQRSALGNDAEAEIAVGANAHPSWIDRMPRTLPPELARKITERSNREMMTSLGKFRNAISELAFAEGNEGQIAKALDFLTWRELIHTSYFDVPEFRKFVSVTVSQLDGFQPNEVLRNDPEYAATLRWLKEVTPQPPTTEDLQTQPAAA